ncbi:hypothetical protein [Streptomyces millisiae]|uniref:Lipoprotein n=1 Tax=Streptomyces millisiae TaxID=3075542 RepID=A0ABU2LTV8_9ACTN|nr:hypothetical protein [Streptomyces sp. DSM 44918]MDT0321036.1 hypothetical protein [Streptomyces sp. DSM 44918]
MGMAFLGVFGCSGVDEEPGASGDGPTDGALENGKSATEVCAGTLSASAARSLESLSGDTVFSDEIETRPTVDLAQFVERLSAPDAFSESFCQVYTATHWNAPFATIEYYWFDDATPPEENDTDSRVNYSAGASAYYADGDAFILFPCSARDVPTEEFLAAVLTLPGLGAEANEDQAVDVLNSVSRAVADALDCLEESMLPEGTPRRLAE